MLAGLGGWGLADWAPLPQGPRRALSAPLGLTASRPVRAAACDPLCSVPPTIVRIAVKFGVVIEGVNIKASSRNQIISRCARARRFLATIKAGIYAPEWGRRYCEW